MYRIFVTDSQSQRALRTQTHDFGYNCATKIVYKDNCPAATEGDMTKQDTEHSLEGQPATQTTTAETAKRSRPLAGFFIAGGALALLFGLAALKGRVKDDNTDRERGLD